MRESNFEWDDTKSLENERKHGVSFYEAQHAFLDPHRLIADDLAHSAKENRFFCIGLDEAGEGILTVRFTYRKKRIRIIGAGYWRKGRKIYEQANSLHG